MTINELREAIENVNDDVVVILRITDDRLNTPTCSPSNATPDTLEDGTEVFMIGGTNGEFKGTGLGWR